MIKERVDIMYTKGKTKGITMKINNVGSNKDITIMIYNMPNFEDKDILKDLFNTFLDRVKNGGVIQAWKFFDISCGFKLTKKINDNLYHFKAC